MMFIDGGPDYSVKMDGGPDCTVEAGGPTALQVGPPWDGGPNYKSTYVYYGGGQKC